MIKKFLIVCFFSWLFLGVCVSQERPVLAVLELEGEGVSKSDARIITSFVEEAIFTKNLYELVSRIQIEKIIEELEYQQSGMCGLECVVDLGRHLAAKKVIYGNVGKLGSIYSIQLKLVDIKTSKIERMKSIRTERPLGQLPDYIENLIENLFGIPTSRIPSKTYKKKIPVKSTDIQILGSDLSIKDEQAYTSALNLNTVTAFAKYLLDFPKGKHIYEARLKILEFSSKMNKEDGALKKQSNEEMLLLEKKKISLMVDKRATGHGVIYATKNGITLYVLYKTFIPWSDIIEIKAKAMSWNYCKRVEIKTKDSFYRICTKENKYIADKLSDLCSIYK